MALSKALRAGFRDNTAVDVWVITAPDGSTWKWAAMGIRSKTFGGFENRIHSFADVGQTVNIDGWVIQTSDTSFVASDHDGFISKFVEGQYGASLAGSPAKLQIIAPRVDDGDEHTEFDGLLKDPKRVAGSADLWLFSVELNRRALLDDVNIPTSSKTLTPQIDDADVNKPYVVPYGFLDSALADNGAVELIRLGDVSEGGSLGSPAYPWRYGGIFGRAQEITALYKDDSYDSVPPAASVIYEVRNGLPVTELGFLTDQGTTKISVDLKGLTTDAEDPSSGSLIVNPVEQIEHFARQFGFNAWSSAAGAWYSAGSAPINVASFAAGATYFSARGAVGARAVSAGQVFETVLTEWSSAHGFPFIWSADGKLSLGVDDHYLDPAASTPIWCEGVDFEPKSFDFGYDGSLVRGEIVADWAESQGSTTRSKRVTEGVYNSAVKRSYSFPWSSRE